MIIIFNWKYIHQKYDSNTEFYYQSQQKIKYILFTFSLQLRSVKYNTLFLRYIQIFRQL
ncbi:unnamed protein product [Paramecium primaurelia]|uniref:Uncharacterized protein n=1 Tax=Paramecium primaurelia TaxID=5886 RepID=A0A8S1Q2U9_PARPR|nr:unnamed protein product [Paramecium primaurelia]